MASALIQVNAPAAVPTMVNVNGVKEANNISVLLQDYFWPNGSTERVSRPALFPQARSVDYTHLENSYDDRQVAKLFCVINESKIEET